MQLLSMRYWQNRMRQKYYQLLQLQQDLWAINEIDKTVMYLINGADKVLLIDTGFGFVDLKGLIREVCGEKPVIVVNTHAHVDHNSGNNQFDEVYVGKYDEPFSHEKYCEEKKKLFAEAFFADSEKAEELNEKWNPGPSRCVGLLKHGDVIDLGNYKVDLIESPSHTVGSFSFYEEMQGWLFTGDIMLEWPVWGHLTDLLLAPSSTLETYYQTLLKLKRYSDRINYVFPSHVVSAKSSDDLTHYMLDPQILSLYCEGVKKILEDASSAKEYRSWSGKGKVVLFDPFGGITFQENRIYNFKGGYNE